MSATKFHTHTKQQAKIIIKNTKTRFLLDMLECNLEGAYQYCRSNVILYSNEGVSWCLRNVGLYAVTSQMPYYLHSE